MNYRFRRFSPVDLDGELKTIWKGIQQQKQTLNFYQTLEWHRAICQHLLAKASIFFVVAFDDTRPLAIFPLQHSRIRLLGKLELPVLQFPSHDHITLSDCLCLDQKLPDLVASLTRYLRQAVEESWHLLRLDNLREDADILRLLADEPNLTALSSVSKQSSSLALKSCYDSTTEHMSKKFLKNIRRLQNKASREGELVYQSVSRLPSLETEYQHFLDIESDGWKGESKTAIKCDAQLVDFYREIVGINEDEIHAVVNLLMIDGKPVATQLGLKINDQLNLLKIGFSEAYKSVGPGNIILVETINHSLEAKDSIINFVTAPPWAENWQSLLRKVWCQDLFNGSLMSTLLYQLLKLKRKLSR